MKALLVILLITQIFTWCPKVTYEEQGKAYADRYWDCCKEWCSWAENAGKENVSRSCDKYGYILKEFWLKSSCEGGEAYCCPSHSPFVDKECKEIAYAFASVPEFAKPECGKCYQLRFLPYGKYEDTLAHKKLAKKVLFIMTVGIIEKQNEYQREIGSDTFDILIPGGGSRESYACKDLYKDLGAPYGGLLTDCENEIGYGYPEEELYNLRKDCLRRKCQEVFPFGSEEYYGCLFLADWMEAASYPLFYWTETECPAELAERYYPKY